jgi:hypothetical protein
MCIGLNINRPEAAIADASRLVIKDIYPSYISSVSFLNSASFNLEQNQDAHGGFGSNDSGKLAIGISRENITGVLPLYLFKEHWSIARRNL